ncbi:hypothetical protein A5844_002723 [Enterococcus sp. 10A9_DIV0425]|uniref:Uncharacterized protein n=1 Tax=Candidatus Enterococcus wittei TaxID=1987383 RepID=A0A242JW66_9ENTE|nr:hypothetical protein [Enterococcus sp. 10A9_DIV0425]OTP06750.1 hypothetical protein A5844_002723 [Enterococcus sp. 10A9_DIV0425]
MKIKSINNFYDRKFQIFFDNEETIRVTEPEYFETLVMLIIKILDNNFLYDTTDNSFEFDNCINFLCIIYQSTVYVAVSYTHLDVYNTTDNSFEFDNCINFLCIIYQSTVYVENIHNKKEIYFTAREEEGYPNLRFFNKTIRKNSEIFFPDFYTYFTGAYSNLNVLYSCLLYTSRCV